MQFLRLFPHAFTHCRIDRIRDGAQHQHVRVIQSHQAWRDTRAKRGFRFPAQFAHRMMAGVAIEQHQFRKQTIPAALFVLQNIHCLCDSQRLPDGPCFRTFPHLLAFGIVLIDHKMFRRDFGKRIEFETHARMPGTHDAMRDQFVLVAEVAGEAQFGACDRVRGWIQAMLNIRRVMRRRIGDGIDVRFDPAFGRTMTRFTHHAIAQFEALAAPFKRNIVRVTIEANFRFVRRLFQAEILCNTFGALVQ